MVQAGLVGRAQIGFQCAALFGNPGQYAPAHHDARIGLEIGLVGIIEVRAENLAVKFNRAWRGGIHAASVAE